MNGLMNHRHPNNDNRDVAATQSSSRVDGTQGGSLKAVGFGDGRESTFVFLFSVSQKIDELPGL
jgi:hypothetical protein